MGTLVYLINLAFKAYMIMLFARVLGSWFPQFQDHPIIRFLRKYTDPYLNFFRRFIPPIGMLDLSPMVAFFALIILENLVLVILL